MKSFIVERWSNVFSILEKLSPFWLVRKVAGKKFPDVVESYGFVELWLLGHLLLSIVLLSICSALNLHWGEAIATGAVIYGGLRVVEVIVYLINVVLFNEYRKRKEECRQKKEGITYVPYALRSYRRIVILLLHNYAEIIVWFALFYRNLDWAYQTYGTSLDSFFAALNFSFVTMTNFGYTTIYPKETLGEVFVFIQSAIGLFMVLLIIARFVSLIPKPKTLDEFER